MGVRNPLGERVNISEAECRRNCLMGVTCMGTEMFFGVFAGTDICTPTYISDFIPKPHSVLYEIVFRCPSK